MSCVCAQRVAARLGFILLTGTLVPVTGMAADLQAQVLNTKGEFVEQAVVTASPLAGMVTVAEPGVAVIDQVDKEFVPPVTVVYQGARISFPNSDNVRHHVYSFSKTRSFEIPLYADKEVPPVVFDRSGVVALGCNVHDWMSAHVFVADTPYFAITDAAGNAQISALPPGDYAVEVWHAQLRDTPEKLRQIVTLGAQGEHVDFTIKQRRAWKAWRGADDIEAGY
jgi:plastocyanin